MPASFCLKARLSVNVRVYGSNPNRAETQFSYSRSNRPRRLVLSPLAIRSMG